MNDIFHVAKDADLTPMPLIAELAQYLQWSGLYKPLEKMYVSTRSLQLPYVAHYFLLFTACQSNRFAYSRQIDGLAVRRPNNDHTDGTAFVVGLGTMLRQLGGSTMQTCCSLLIQLVRSLLEARSK